MSVSGDGDGRPRTGPVRPRADPGAVEAAFGAGRDDGREGEGSELEGAAHVVGTSGSRRHVDERRHARHPDDAAGGAVGTRVADAGGVRAAGGRRRGVAGPRRQPGDVPPQRVRHAHVRLHVARRRSAERPDAGAHAGRPGASSARVRRRHVRQPARSTTSRTSASTTAASRAASAGSSRCSTATACGSCRRRTKSSITYEMIHDTRVIPLDGRPHVGAASSSTWATRAATGKATRSSSRRRTSRTRDRASAARNSEKLKLTERFTRIDPEMIDYRVRVDDPATYTAPFTIRLTITTAAELPALRVLVPRGQRRGGPRAQRRARVRAAGRGRARPRACRFRRARWAWRSTRAAGRRPPARA